MQRDDLTAEPSLEDALADPIVHAVMARDLVTLDELRRVVEMARRKLVGDEEDLAA